MTGERGDDALMPRDVARLLGVSRQTVYTIPYLRQRAFRPTGRRGLRWDRRDVEAYKAMMTVGTREVAA